MPATTSCWRCSSTWPPAPGWPSTQRSTSVTPSASSSPGNPRNAISQGAKARPQNIPNCGHQTGLAVDGALQDRQAGCPAGDVEADAAGDRHQPGAGRFDGVLLLPGQGVPAGVGLLHGIFGLGQGAQQPVGEIDQLAPAAPLVASALAST